MMTADDPEIPSAKGDVAPASRAPYPSAVSFGLNGSLYAEDMIRKALGSAEVAPPIEYPEDAPDTNSPTINFSFKAKKYADLQYTIQPGDVEIDGGAPIAWASIGNNGIIRTIPDSNSEWFMWIDVVPVAKTIDGTTHAKSAVLAEGATVPALDDSKSEYMIRRKVVQIVMDLVDGNRVISAVKNLACGNIDVAPFPTDTEADGRTIEFNNSDGDAIEGKLQIRGANAVASGNVSVPSLSGPNDSSSGGPQSIAWIRIDGAATTADGKSIGVRIADGAKIAEVYGFKSASSETLDLETEDLMLFRRDSECPAMQYADYVKACKWMQAVSAAKATWNDSDTKPSIDGDQEWIVSSLEVKAPEADEDAFTAILKMVTSSDPRIRAVRLTWDGDVVKPALSAGKRWAVSAFTVDTIDHTVTATLAMVQENDPGLASDTSGLKFSWRCSMDAEDSAKLNITHGEVEVAPDIVIPWEDIEGTDNDYISLGASCHIVVDVDVADKDAPTAILRYGAEIDPIPPEDRSHIRRKKIADVTYANGKITLIEQRQCGNVEITL